MVVTELLWTLSEPNNIVLGGGVEPQSLTNGNLNRAPTYSINPPSFSALSYNAIDPHYRAVRSLEISQSRVFLLGEDDDNNIYTLSKSERSLQVSTSFQLSN